MTTALDEVVVRRVGLAEYSPMLAEMRRFTAARAAATPDELWLVEHPAVYTLGQAAPQPSLANRIPVVRSDRGGQITYHGPGQAVLYALVDLARRGIKVREFVRMLEQSVLEVLDADCGIQGQRKPGAPGVYVEGAKIAALGVRITRGRSYHGVALNVAMDLAPFAAIDPCGYPGLAVTDLRSLGRALSVAQAGEALAARLVENLGDA